jgi:hypothetical protein
LDLFIGASATAGEFFGLSFADDLYDSRPGREDVWSPTVLGLSKRDLLKDVLSIFGQSVCCWGYRIISHPSPRSAEQNFDKTCDGLAGHVEESSERRVGVV